MIRSFFRILFLIFIFSKTNIGSEPLNEEGFRNVSEYPFIEHDTDRTSLQKAFRQSEFYIKKLPENWQTTIYGETYSKKDLSDSLRTLKRIFEEKDPERKRTAFQKNFLLLETRPKNEKSKITGYYEVLMEGRRYPEGEFEFPVLETPSDLFLQKKKSDNVVVKKENDVFTPYPTRLELNKDSEWKGKTSALAYVRIVDLHLAQLEGSAKVKIPGQSPFRITYSADNGRKYRSPAESLKGICKSLIPSDLRNCISEFPKEVKDAILQNPRYVFFKRESFAPRGGGGIELIPERSVAMDPAIPLGLPALLSFRSPLKYAVNRIVFVHDRGSEIKGHGRLDYFLGTGETAESAAGKINSEGRILLILPKK
ncbi:murein transglycosylase [Leptospira gomenensis]|uniref:peptidoglycan lytic exotransglycosylase n=1 Tax=Leptospira gomenensis TaxID=2484974 RepID=A0A5F1YU23_9LEPT|nr:MltA domain-containing protein [Leptospira gomenensis]TGK36032.1 murein transglycosylase [Leptospira gomenensis]TGK43955.1 murein transglycosylase [Leptospira gomenensis]TGK53365.1 murein transglycosylase [Leptospira gomenensis]TGK60701.1 murein transglycosylase [Leptospira gomenensis]